MIVQRHHVVHGLVREAAPQMPKYPTPLVMIPGGSHGWWASEEWLPFFAEARLDELRSLTPQSHRLVCRP